MGYVWNKAEDSAREGYEFSPVFFIEAQFPGLKGGWSIKRGFRMEGVRISIYPFSKGMVSRLEDTKEAVFVRQRVLEV